MNIDEAITYSANKLGRCLSQQECTRQLKYFTESFEKSLTFEKSIATEEAQAVWQKQIKKIEDWQSSTDFKNGNFPHGINELILELVEWRALIFSLQNTETEKNPIGEHFFLEQWLIGGTYAIFSLLGKLTSKDRRDNSLRNLWIKMYLFIELEEACTKVEIDYINNIFNEKNGYFTNQKSQALHFRNTVISHNEKNLTIEWEVIDKDIEILVRIWSILVSWCTWGLVEPFRKSEHTFSGLEYFFSHQDIEKLTENRKKYFDLVYKWSVTYLYNGERDPANGAFIKIVVTSSVL